MAYNAGKNLTLLYSAWKGKKKISRGLGNKKSYPTHPPAPPPLKSQMVDP